MEIASIPYKNINDGSKIFKPNYHLNYGKKRITQALKKKKEFFPLKQCISAIFKGGFDKSYFIEDEQKAYKYISAQHLAKKLAIESGKLISKKLTTNYDEMVLKNKQILISCAGTIGNTRLIGNDLDGVLGSQDIIRIEANENEMPYGFLYAYLSSPTAYNYMQSFIYGSVVPRIDTFKLGTLPVPKMDKNLIKIVNDKIIKSKELRESAYLKLKESHKIFDCLLFDEPKRPFYKTHTKSNLFKYQSRLDSCFNIEYEYYTSILFKKFGNIEKLGLFINDAFIPNRGKRLYTKKGLRYLSTSDISTLNPSLINKNISLKTPGISSIPVKKDWILIARSGQEILGSTFYVSKTLENLGVNEHALRIVTDKKFSKYTYAYLSSKFGKKYLRSGIFGSAILTINEDFVKELYIPIIEKEKEVEIINTIGLSIEEYDEADYLEKQAIDLIEKEIELWQK